ncbi:MAG: HD domain-containing protein [Victivallales bacterium]|nr:HD domain-containing protein [Victivallales bacterium]
MKDISLERLHKSADWPSVEKIATQVQAAGGRAFLVGGCVRDLLQGYACKDFDIEVYHLPLSRLEETLSRNFKYTHVGVSFGVLKLDHHEIDVALPRTENKTGAGHRGFIVSSDPNLPFQEAASRRDFTLNAIMLDPLTGELVDPLGGRNDLEHGLLRHCSEHFAEDPLRVLRAMQFTARFEFTVAPETVEMCASLDQSELAAERLAGEWEKLLLKGKRPSNGLRFLRDCRWIRFYPELQALIGCEQTPVWHPEGDVWNHTLQVLDAAAVLRSDDHNDDLALMLAALCHDLGKPATSDLNEQGSITSYGHPEAGVPLTAQFISRIWNQPDLLELVQQLVRYHMEPYSFARYGAKDSRYRRLACAVKRLDLLYKLALADINGTFDRP